MQKTFIIDLPFISDHNYEVKEYKRLMVFAFCIKFQ
jgi:hypothetical protein